MQSIYVKTPEPTNVSVSLVNKAYRDITVAESEAQKIWVDLQVILSKSEKFKPTGKLVEDKWNKMTQIIADTLADADEYTTMFAGAPVTKESKGSATGHTPASRDPLSSTMKSNLERLPLPSFDGTKKNYLRFFKEFLNHIKNSTRKERMIALKSKCLTKTAKKN